MADKKLNTEPEQAPQPSLFDTGPADAPAPEVKPPEQAAGEPPAQDAPAGAPGDVVVSADQIEKLMAERNAAARAEVDKTAPPEPKQPLTTAPEEKSAEEKKPAPEEKPRAGVAVSPRKKKRSRINREGRAPAGAAR